MHAMDALWDAYTRERRDLRRQEFAGAVWDIKEAKSQFKMWMVQKRNPAEEEVMRELKARIQLLGIYMTMFMLKKDLE